MRHRVKGKHLSRNTNHRRALRMMLMTALLQHERIETTRAKADFVRGEVEKLITLAKRGLAHEDPMRAIHARAIAGSLSGGNQQKIVLGKWLSMKPRVILFDEPTRGIDVGAKAEIYALMRELAGRGTSILMISSDMEEILANSDRVAVMHEGRLTGILERAACTEEAIMRLAVA